MSNIRKQTDYRTEFLDRFCAMKYPSIKYINSERVNCQVYLVLFHGDESD